MPYINVDEAYILDNTGLQVDNSVDYANANGNRNLLDNPFFTVNQRDFTTVTGSASGLALVDRWLAIRATVTQNADNSLTVTPTQAQYGICQFFEQNRLKVGQTYTMSALIDNEYYSGSFVFSTSPASEYFATFSNGIRFYRHVANDKVDVWVIRSSTTAFTVQAVKLEVGSYSTLINDAPPNYAEELTKCRYYFERIKTGAKAMTLGFGYPDGYNTLYAHFKINPKRSTSMGLVTGSSFVVGDATGMSTAVSSASIYNFLENGEITLALTATGAFAPPNMYRCGIPANSHVDFSADL